MSSISIHPATPSDVKAMGVVGQAAFKKDKLYQAGLPPTMTSSQHEQYNEWRNKLAVQRMNGENKHYFKAVDSSTGELVGVMGWVGPTKTVAAENAPRYPDMPEFLDKKFFDDLAEGFKEAQKKVMGERKDYWFIFAMYVHPEFQGRGIASKLMEHGLENLVDRDELDCYLESSADPGAKALYHRNGFKTILNIPVLDGQYVMSAMVRKARAKTGEED